MTNNILTGDRPTGKLHLGHYVGSLLERIRLQNEEKYDNYFILIADAQALTDNFNNPTKIRESIIEVMLDYLASGLDPNKISFCIQSQISALPELTQYYMNLVTLSRVLRNPTVKSEIQLRGFDEKNCTANVPIGFVNYPVSQVADITAFKANLVPVGEDQLPMIEQTNEVVKSFNRIYKTDTLVYCKALLNKNEVCQRLPGTDGCSKMSKSLNNCIYLSDDEDVIKKKVNLIKTFPRTIDEPGILKDNILFIYLTALCKNEHFKKYYNKYNSLDELKSAYKKGGIGDAEIKKFLFEVINDVLKPIREKREYYKNNIEEVLKILKEGTNKANEVAAKTLLEVKSAMKINYSDESFYKEALDKYKNN